MESKLAAAMAVAVLWASTGNAATIENGASGQLISQPAATEYWKIGSVNVPKSFDLSPIAMANAQTISDGIAPAGVVKRVPVSGSALFIGTGILALFWVGWRRSQNA